MIKKDLTNKKNEGKCETSMISVIIPFFNAEKFIESCISGLMKQTSRNFEVILIDDGSNDSTYEIFDSLTLSNDICFQYIKQKNKGVSSARNRGISASSGESIIFIDVDDQIDADFILSFSEMARKEVDLVCCSYYIDYPNEKRKVVRQLNKIDFSSLTFNESIFNLDKLGMLNVVWNKMFKKSIITENEIWFDEQLKSGEDLVFVLQYCDFASSVEIIEKPLYNYLRIEKYSTLMRYISDLHIDMTISADARENFYRKNFISNGDIDGISRFLDAKYMGSRIAVLNNSFRSDAPRDIRYKVINILLNDKKLLSISYLTAPESLVQRIFLFCIKKGKKKLMLFLYSVLFFFRNRLSSIYVRFRNKIV